jgi:hypothetical protein
VNLMDMVALRIRWTVSQEPLFAKRSNLRYLPEGGEVEAAPDCACSEARGVDR